MTILFKEVNVIGHIDWLRLIFKVNRQLTIMA